MHIPDGFLSVPVWVGAAVVSAAVVGIAAARARKSLGEQQVPMLGVCSAFIFAAQMLNFPVASGTSGHFGGAAMATALLGPFNAIICLTVVLIIQCFVFLDGGVTALGANVLNMGVLPAFAAWAVQSGLIRVLPRKAGVAAATSGVSAWVAVVLGATACAIELGLSGKVPMGTALGAMVGVHAVIGVGEAIITSAVVATVAAARPDLLRMLAPTEAAL